MGKNELEHEILLTLSFMEPMGLDRIFLELDRNFTDTHPELTYQDLLETLAGLQQRKKVKLIQQNNHKQWIKIFPRKKGLYRRLIERFCS